MKSKNELKETDFKNHVCYFVGDVISGKKLILVIFY